MLKLSALSLGAFNAKKMIIVQGDMYQITGTFSGLDAEASLISLYPEAKLNVIDDTENEWCVLDTDNAGEITLSSDLSHEFSIEFPRAKTYLIPSDRRLRFYFTLYSETDRTDGVLALYGFIKMIHNPQT